MMRSLLVLAFAIMFLPALTAQLQRVMHQSFTLDTAHHLILDLPGEYEVTPWAGDNILTETKIQLYDASEGILKHFIKEGRYQLEENKSNDTLRIFAFDPERNPIRTLEGESSELIQLRIFVPESFEAAGHQHWRRQE